ncbi:MAG: bifunctional UDP-N-acetylmuramoyl-tripeptide:D-alanyl-D-alanine ligase/alanine racemase [Bacteroidetes bacterium]|nr:bifunctional UDP-N-acetylmuramoyl-tripeptide:D-alanyl-D-alanine ligase/alanine racemase [Bacteroidota bacterium]
MNYTLSNIASFVKGELHGQDVTISHVFTDSRQLPAAAPEQCLFVAISSPRQSGVGYISDLYAKGYRNFMVESLPTGMSDANYILVSNSLDALQLWAAHHRSQFRMPLIGITGSNGKTVVKEWLYQLLHKDFNIVRSPGSFNSQLGVPLSLLQIEKNHSLAIIEAGISKVHEMTKLQAMIKPDLMILTHMGTAHNEGFESYEQKVGEKLQLAEHADCLIYCKDDEVVSKLVSEFLASHFIKTYSWSAKYDATVSIYKIDKQADQTNIQFIYKSTTLSYTIPFTDEASIENSVTCICALLAIERLDLDILEAFSRLQPVSGRLEQKKAINNSLLINDSYSNDIHSLQSALNFVDRQNPLLNKTVILSDLLETGEQESTLYEKIHQLLVKHRITKLIGIGESFAKYAQLFTGIEPIYFYPSTDDYINHFSSRTISNEIILLKGARKFQFEKIVSLLEKQRHQTVLEIDLDAVVHNLNIYKERLAKNTKLMVMVKAFSYGSGSFELAKLLQHHRVDYLAVAYEDEGVMLRNAGITLPIMVMNASVKAFKLMLDFEIEPTIYSLEMLRSLVSFIQYTSKKIGVHLEFETGMNRLGISTDELDEVIAILQNHPQIDIKSAFTHMASADDATDDDFTQKQLLSFKEVHTKLCDALKKNILSHAANTAGITRFNGYNLGMARLGIGLHGIDPSAEIQDHLKPVSRLKSIVTQVRRVKKGESIGYNRKTKAEQDFNMAVVAIGYADGLNRMLSNRKCKLYINGVACDIVGNICMDMCMIDLGELNLHEGQEVIIFENVEQLQAMAQTCETIIYEILTGISERITRIYLQE